MSFLQDVKYSYFKNNINGLIKEKNFLEIKKLLNQINQKSPEIYKKIIFNNIQTILENDSSNIICNNRLVWINAFGPNDLIVIKNFLNFYFDKFTSIPNYKLVNYLDKFTETLSNNVSFQDIIDFSYAVQFLITQEKEYYLLENYSSFFVSSDKKKLFTHKNLTQSYIYILNSPYKVYSDLKKIHQSKDIAINVLTNADKRLNLLDNKSNEFKMEIPILGWGDHFLSWADSQVQNDFRGLLLNYEDLFKDPYDFLTSIILHLINQGMKIEIEYDLINLYIKNNSNLFQPSRGDEISNNEYKLINNHFGNLIHDFNLEFER